MAIAVETAADVASDGVALRFPARETAVGKAVVLSSGDVLGHLEPMTVGSRVETVLDRLDVALRARPTAPTVDCALRELEAQHPLHGPGRPA